MSKTLKELAQLVSGEVLGEAGTKINGVSHPQDAKDGQLVFVLERQLLKEAESSKASALVVSHKYKTGKKPCLVVSDPRLAMAIILGDMYPKKHPFKGIHKNAVVERSARIGRNTIIYPHVYIGENVAIGDDCVIYPNVTVYENVTVGNRVVLQAGCRIGLEGFGFAQQDKKFKKIPQIGTVIIGDDVEIYSNSTVARGALGPTIIGAGTKIDTLTHIAHNCKIGKNCAVVSLVGFAGSVTVGDNVAVGGQAGFNGHVSVGDNTVILARAGVTKDIPANSVVSGFPAKPHRLELKEQAALRRLLDEYRRSK
ncbi:MAG: UDP-3-O-(3-hydroxymyristoyl)glucosamine N-acyltransferase [Candidatus Margulisbacteria bacterium]|nr:UDP-3-O-(3-hydroxymyristoyl)glucosamine N-acyltransferase [Candidatus Margulisiibacteriota bacterium]